MKAKVLSVGQCDALTVVQLATEPLNTFGYISYAKGLELKAVEIMESSQSGSVNEIYAINHSRHCIFIMDGDILAGAKQNRVLNTSVLLSPESKTMIPVSCVEQGRWNHKSVNFSATDYIAPVEMRKAKSEKVAMNLKTSNSFMADQGEVWDRVASYSAKMNIHSETGNLSDVYDNRSSVYEKYISKFRCEENANGIAFFINGKPVNIDVFNRTDVFKEYFSKMLKGIAMDAWGVKATKEMSQAEADYKTIETLDKLEAVDFELHNGVGLGEEKRFKTNEIAGFELDYNGNLVHLSVLSLG